MERSYLRRVWSARMTWYNPFSWFGSVETSTRPLRPEECANFSEFVYGELNDNMSCCSEPNYLVTEFEYPQSEIGYRATCDCGTEIIGSVSMSVNICGKRPLESGWHSELDNGGQDDD